MQVNLKSRLQCQAAVLLGAALFVALLMPPPKALAGTVAAAVLGQTDFTHGTANTPDGSSLNVGSNFSGLALDVHSTPPHLYLADYFNNRVLGFNDTTSLANGAPAVLVIGQPDFNTTGCNSNPLNGAANLCNPRGIAVDSSENVYVADGSNNRVLIYPNPFATMAATGQTGGFTAFMVLGQAGDFTSIGCNVGGALPSAGTLCSPLGLTLDSSNNLYVADSSNNRILEYNNPVGTGILDAHLVFGQPSFTANSINQGGSPSANTLNLPLGLAVDSFNNLYVGDRNNNRVLEFNTPLTKTAVSGSGDTTADKVWGQGGSFGLANCNGGGISAVSLCNPEGVALDSSNHLYVGDRSNNRVLEYNESTNPPTNLSANMVFGQGTGSTAFSTNTCNLGGLSPSSLCATTGNLLLDPAGNLGVFDTGNNRMVGYTAPLSTGEAATRVLGQVDFTHNAPNSVDASAFNTPRQVAIDASTSTHHLYLADFSNNRVLGWVNATSFASGAPADLVIGQPDFSSNLANTGGPVSGSAFNGPSGATVDAAGNLYVADQNNSRVLEFTGPFASCSGTFPCVFKGSANKIFGQSSSTGSGCNNGGISANSLCSPARVALDLVGNLYVADQGNNRVLEYNTPLTTTTVTGSGDTTADLVIGQGTTGTGTEFTTNGANQGGLSANSLSGPQGVATDPSNNIYIADTNNNRVLEFTEPTNSTTAPNNVIANTVFGQLTSFTANACNNTGLTANSLCAPNSLAADSSGDLFVADTSNSRMLEFFTPLSTDTTADIVWGQGGDLATNPCNLGGGPAAATLCRSQDVTVDSTGAVLIADTANNRGLRYAPPFSPPGSVAPSSPPLGVLEVAPSRLTFAALTVGRESRIKKVRVTNSGWTPVNIGDISVSGGEFLTGGDCGAVLPAGQRCTVSVTFKPITAGRRGGQLIISDDAANSPHVVRLRGRARRRRHR